MLGALLAGQGTDYAPTCLASALSHAIGARFHLDNGITEAVLLPHAMRFNAEATQDRLAVLASALGAHTAGSRESIAVDTVERLFTESGLPRRPREIGVREESLAVIADDVSGGWFLHQNPRPVSGRVELLGVLRQRGKGRSDQRRSTRGDGLA